ncbi:antirestriction protein ArdA [Ruminococcus bicirculans (ex Wegman et al. 2014)]|uniref:antirestriction protein ArdA n=1 Tax=Ruminococcus bicirculans (ex Wegman et al. 2014) TaxID=1160721 RepID=UPI0022E810B6|nr:antirestriction protein ArdA [Ruminococcus bicirculans (ex Wegman et al. 2014)]
MPYYDHDKDYPFAAFITNLGKYNEGELVGEWVKFPTTAEELKEVFKRIGIGQKDDFGQPYEEWFITDYDCYVDGLYSKLGEYENLDELNYLASKLDEMSESEYAQFQAGMEMGDHCGSLQEIINLTENLDCYEVYPDIHDYDDLGRYYIEELDVMQVPEHLQNYIDYEAYGRDVALEENGTFTDQGYVRDTGDSFHEYYDGERGSIPDEYRVMTFQDDLPEEEKSEWAMDIAFDMDEFFRQNDPQYAAEHPEAHAAKEEIYESLMAGRISALDEKLAALGQKQEDYLPSEIEKFKDATGYEEFLDFDPAEVKAALENPDKSRIDEMLAFAEKAEREYMAEAAGYVQTPADIAEQAQAVPRDTFSIYQLKSGNETLDYRFEPLDAIRSNGLSVKPENYELVYTAPLTEKDSLESIYTRFNIDRPADFKGHSLSVSDIVVLHQDGNDTAHYCDRFGFSQVPEFLQPERAAEVTIPTPDQMATQERINTPRGSFCVTNMTREQMEVAGYGVHHQSDDGKYLIMGNGTRAFAVLAEQPEKDNPLRTAEMTLEDDYGMIDGVINNGRRGEELEKAKEHSERTTPEKPSIRERLEDAKRECAEHKPLEGKKPGRDVPEHDCL